MTPEFLAALAQVEGSGNPIVRTYWRWSWRPEPFEMYRPASSAVGMYQITDGTFEEAKRFCIHDHVVVEDGPWDDWHSCWFTGLYFRVVPSHAVELTSAYLDRGVADALIRHRIRSAHTRAEAEPRNAHAPVRGGRRKSLRRSGISACARPAMRRPQRRRATSRRCSR